MHLLSSNSRKLPIEHREPFRQRPYISQNLVAHVTTHALQVVMARFIHRETERNDFLTPCFHERHMSVMNRVFLLYALTAITPVLRATITNQEHDLSLGVLIL